MEICTFCALLSKGVKYGGSKSLHILLFKGLAAVPYKAVKQWIEWIHSALGQMTFSAFERFIQNCCKMNGFSKMHFYWPEYSIFLSIYFTRNSCGTMCRRIWSPFIDSSKWQQFLIPRVHISPKFRPLGRNTHTKRHDAVLFVTFDEYLYTVLLILVCVRIDSINSTVQLFVDRFCSKRPWNLFTYCTVSTLKFVFLSTKRNWHKERSSFCSSAHYLLNRKAFFSFEIRQSTFFNVHNISIWIGFPWKHIHS